MSDRKVTWCIKGAQFFSVNLEGSSFSGLTGGGVDKLYVTQQSCVLTNKNINITIYCFLMSWLSTAICWCNI